LYYSQIAYEGYTIPSSFSAYQDIFNEVKQAIKQNESMSKFSLMQVLDGGRHQAATEPKDAIFALYGLLQQINPDMIAADYSKSVEEIYTEVTKMVIQFDKSLQILETTGEDSARGNLPTWVPECR